MSFKEFIMAGAADYYNTFIREDSQWVRAAYFSNKFSILGEIFNVHKFASADIKFTDSSPGGNFGINPKPQFTEYADIVRPGIGPDSYMDGMGEYYSEAYDDHAQLINLQFGVPEYNGLSTFFLSYYDSRLAALATTGKATGFLFDVGNAIGFILTLPFQAIVGAANLVSRMVNFIADRPQSKFFYLKPTMPLYLSTVNTLAVRLGVNLGLVQGSDVENINGKTVAEVKADAKKNKRGISYSNGLSPSEAAVFNRLLPDVMTADGGIDIIAMTSRAQRLANKHNKILHDIGKAAEKSDKYTYNDLVRKYVNDKMDPPTPESFMLQGDPSEPSILKYTKQYFQNSPIGQGEGNIPDVTMGDKDAAIAYGNDTTPPKDDKRKNTTGLWDRVPAMFKAEMNQGTHWVGFYVDAQKTVSESFTNTTKSSGIEEKLNANSSKVRSTLFDFGHGNIGDGAVASVIEGAFSGIKNLMAGGLASIGLGSLAGLGGTSYVDIPDFWESASASLPSNDYTITLATPYGNKMSVYLNIYIPLCMLLAGVLPLSTGKNSYTSPFLCRLESTGRNMVRTGIIDKVTITRGTGNTGWSKDKLPTSVDVTFSVIDLSKTMHAPISPSGGLTDLLSLSMFDEDTVLTDYLLSLGGVTLYDQYAAVSPRLRLAWRKQMASFDRWLTPEKFTNWFSGTGPGNIMSIVFAGGDRGAPSL